MSKQIAERDAVWSLSFHYVAPDVGQDTGHQRRGGQRHNPGIWVSVEGHGSGEAPSAAARPLSKQQAEALCCTIDALFQSESPYGVMRRSAFDWCTARLDALPDAMTRAVELAQSRLARLREARAAMTGEVGQ